MTWGVPVCSRSPAPSSRARAATSARRRLGLEQHGVAEVAAQLGREPPLAAVRHGCERAPVGERDRVGTPLELPARDVGREPHRRRARGRRQLVVVAVPDAGPRLEDLVEELGRADAVDAERALARGRPVVRVDVPVAAHAADPVRLDLADADPVAATREVLDPHDAVLAHAPRQHGEDVFGQRQRAGLGRLEHRVPAERGLDLGADGLERRARVGRDQRADQIECQKQRLRLERRQPRGLAEVVAVELLLDRDDRVVLDQLRVDRVAAAAEAHEVEELEVLLERLRHEAVAGGRAGRPECAHAARRHTRRGGRPSAPAARRSAPGRRGSHRLVREARSAARRAPSARRAAAPLPRAPGRRGRVRP